MSRKPIEKQLYEIYLDLYYSGGLLDDIIKDMVSDLKDLRTSKRKNVKLLEKARQHIVETTGREPMKPRG